jgi:hypothetical protein
MKKSTIVAAVTAGLLGFSGAAIAMPAGWTPSMTLEDLIVLDSESSGITTDDKSESIMPSLTFDTTNPRVKDAYAMLEGFDPDAAANANTAIFDILGDTVECAEVLPVIVVDYHAGQRLYFHLNTTSSYKIGDKVAVLLTINDKNGVTSTYVVMGEATDTNTITFEVDEILADQLANGTAFAAIYNAPGTLL